MVLGYSGFVSVMVAGGHVVLVVVCAFIFGCQEGLFLSIPP